MEYPCINHLTARVNYEEIYSDVALTFDSVGEILWCDHSNETSSAVLLHGTICFAIFYETKFGIFLKFSSMAQITMVKCTNAGGRTKGVNEKAIVLVHRHGRDDVT